MENPSDTQVSSSIVSVANDQIDKKLQSTFDLGTKALNTAEAQEIIKAYGLESYVKNVKQENVKNVLALAGSWFLISKSKQHWKWVLGGFAAMYFYAKTTSPDPQANTIASTIDPKVPMSGYNKSMY